MTDEDDFLALSDELTLRIEPRVRELLAAAGVPPTEAGRVLAGALRYVRLRQPARGELERRFLFAVERECRRYREGLWERVAVEIEELFAGRDDREEES